jgi:hypothetical protein
MFSWAPHQSKDSKQFISTIFWGHHDPIKKEAQKKKAPLFLWHVTASSASTYAEKGRHRYRYYRLSILGLPAFASPRNV